MGRITIRDLNATVDRINRLTNSPMQPYVNVGDKYVAQIDCYHLSGAYGGYALHRMYNDGGGVSDVFGGHLPKRELYERMHAFIRGIEAGSERRSKVYVR